MKMRQKKLINILYGLCLLPAVSFADVRIVTVVPKSGSYQTFGNELITGAEIAVSEINKEGGLLGQKIELISIDDACNENLALSTAQMLSVSKDAKPNLVIGPYCSDGLKQIAKVYEQARIFQIVPAFLTEKETKSTSSGLIKLFGNKEQAADDLFEFYNSHFAGENIALISTLKQDSVDQSILRVFKKHGKSSLIKQYYLPDFESIDDLILSLHAQNEKIILMLSKPKHAAKIIKKLKQTTPDTSFIISRYMATPEFFTNAEKYLDTTYFMALPELENKPEMAAHIVKLRLSGIELQGLNVYGYTAVKMWAELVKSSKTFNYSKLASRIKKHGFKTSWSETFFNNGNLKKTLKYSFYKLQGDEYVLQ